jgi:hypothetical protein
MKLEQYRKKMDEKKRNLDLVRSELDLKIRAAP